VAALVVGADAVFPNAFINKGWTALPVARANDPDLPIIMVAETQKWVPQSCQPQARWLSTAADRTGTVV
jgi:translation initiation factor 2B subunit (eIF-2B alpha/beta/delta family)